ncbi:chloride channel-like protein CLC-g [Pyrus ussuriensis x Pyrus communis]|uniref:Chloride channel-like protein CLC-g n=1 Tax=Pyrus ussuriensis x Pyrus communis TaxID=2448454 RepID=A0A5N5FBH9_9ROSA|nr:chloride channel-like protein CLC-g [Pyrus ussuriensis x Pyrus communis]
MEWDFKNDCDRRDLVTCGAAAGIAASFRSPVGGVLFAFEEMASWWRSALLWRAFFTTALIAIVLQALAASAPPPWLLPLNVINKIKVCQLTPKDLIRLLASASALPPWLLPLNVINKTKVCQLTPKDLLRLLSDSAWVFTHELSLADGHIKKKK